MRGQPGVETRGNLPQGEDFRTQARSLNRMGQMRRPPGGERGITREGGQHGRLRDGEGLGGLRGFRIAVIGIRIERGFGQHRSRALAVQDQAEPVRLMAEEVDPAAFDQVNDGHRIALAEQELPGGEPVRSPRNPPQFEVEHVGHDRHHVADGIEPPVLPRETPFPQDPMKPARIAAAIGFAALSALLAGLAPGITQADPGDRSHRHAMHHAEPAPSVTPAEPGQSAFAAIAEIVEVLRRDPRTDWSRVDIEALRRHLIDMDNVTLRSDVAVSAQPDGLAFDVTAPDAAVVQSIRRMVFAHAATMTGVDGMAMVADEIPGGARLVVTGGRVEMVRGLGFIGLMTLGMHHQAHHLALARGDSPHARH